MKSSKNLNKSIFICILVTTILLFIAGIFFISYSDTGYVDEFWYVPAHFSDRLTMAIICFLFLYNRNFAISKGLKILFWILLLFSILVHSVILIYDFFNVLSMFPSASKIDNSFFAISCGITYSVIIVLIFVIQGLLMAEYFNEKYNQPEPKEIKKRFTIEIFTFIYFILAFAIVLISSSVICNYDAENCELFNSSNQLYLVQFLFYGLLIMPLQYRNSGNSKRSMFFQILLGIVATIFGLTVFFEFMILKNVSFSSNIFLFNCALQIIIIGFEVLLFSCQVKQYKFQAIK